MNTTKESDFNRGVRHGENIVLTSLLQDSDKLSTIHALFGKSSIMAREETDPIKKAQLEAYSEGFRHSVNILQNLGSALEAYQNIINASISIPINEKEIKMYS